MLQAVCTYFNGLNKINVEVSELYLPEILEEFVPLTEVFYLVIHHKYFIYRGHTVYKTMYLVFKRYKNQIFSLRVKLQKVLGTVLIPILIFLLP